jgi:hypothetical protein
MADSKISALTGASTPLAGTEVLPIVQSGNTVKATVANIVGAGTSPGSFTNITGSANAIISVTDNTNAALRITQLGTGNALLVEDSANPDATPFVINNAGNTFIGYGTSLAPSAVSGSDFQVNSVGTTQASITASQWTATGSGSAQILLTRSLSGARGTQTIVTSGTALGKIRSFGSDGTNLIEAASIESFVDGTPGTNDMPGRLVFSTTADGASSTTERMRIDNAGNVALSTGNLIVSTTGKGVTTGSSIPLGFGVNNGTALMTLATDGSLGLGVVVPEAPLHLYSPYPVISMEESDAAANNKKWWFEINGGVYQGRILNDAANAASTWIKVTRSGTTVSSVELPSSNLTMGTAAKGVNFTANTPAAGMTSQLLNWYEEGTWTPVPANLTVVGTPTYTGKYTRIGRMVSCIATIDSTTSTAASAGSTSFGGLPFASVAISGTNAGNGTTVDTNLTTQVGSGYIFSANNKFYVTGWTATPNIVMSFVFYTS